MLRHTSPHNRLWGGEETALFSGFFCWNSTLALKKGAEITLACASSPPLQIEGGGLFLAGISLSVPSCFLLWAGLRHTDRLVSEVFTGNADVKVDVECCQRASVVSEEAPVCVCVEERENIWAPKLEYIPEADTWTVYKRTGRCFWPGRTF